MFKHHLAADISSFTFILFLSRGRIVNNGAKQKWKNLKESKTFRVGRTLRGPAVLQILPTNLMLCCCGPFVHGPGAREGRKEGLVIPADWHVWGAGKTPA